MGERDSTCNHTLLRSAMDQFCLPSDDSLKYLLSTDHNSYLIGASGGGSASVAAEARRNVLLDCLIDEVLVPFWKSATVHTYTLTNHTTIMR